MPILNPKTGEKDYVDISKVSQIIIDPVTVYNLDDTSDKLKISIEVKGLASGEVILSATPGSSKNEQETTIFSLEDFEEIVAECVYSESDKRLENVESFKKRLDILISNIITKKKAIGEYYIEPKVKYQDNNGVGLIYDCKLQREVGTFEHISFSLQGSTNIEARITLPFLQGKQVQELKSDPESITFQFFSLKDKCVYYINPENLNYTEDGTNIAFFSTKTLVNVDDFPETHEKYQIVVEAQKNSFTEESLDKLDLNDPLNKMQFDEFKEGRLILLKNSQEKAKKQKIVNQFADIDLF